MPPSPPPPLRRFEFVDGPSGTGYWSAGNGGYNDVACAADGFVYFQWSAAYHDVMLLPSEAAFDACDFTGATTLAPINSPASSNGLTSYYLPCATPGSTLYVSCSVGSHCAAGGQKVKVHVSASEFVYNTSDPNREVLIHSDSLARVHTVLGHRHDATTGFNHLDLGYHTEASANASLELIWCLEAHCPQSAHDVDPSATYDTCMADVYNLGGFVSRKRPLPDFAHSERYYHTALSHDPYHCPTLGYLSELYLMMGNASAATATALTLCAACGGATSSAALQAKAAFDAAALVAFPCEVEAAPQAVTGDGGGANGGVIAAAAGGGVGALILLAAAYYKCVYKAGGLVVEGASIGGKSPAPAGGMNTMVSSTPSCSSALA